MQTLKLSIGQKIENVGEIKGFYFSDLFTISYKIEEDTYYELDEIKQNMLNSKSKIYEKLLEKLSYQPEFVFKYLNKIMLKTQNLYLINKLNTEVDKIKSIIKEDSFQWNNYQDRTSVKNILENFFFIYYLR